MSVCFYLPGLLRCYYSFSKCKKLFQEIQPNCGCKKYSVWFPCLKCQSKAQWDVLYLDRDTPPRHFWVCKSTIFNLFYFYRPKETWLSVTFLSTVSAVGCWTVPLSVQRLTGKASQLQYSRELCVYADITDLKFEFVIFCGWRSVYTNNSLICANRANHLGLINEDGMLLFLFRTFYFVFCAFRCFYGDFFTLKYCLLLL